MTTIYISDPQDITCAGIQHVCAGLPDFVCRRALDKADLIQLLQEKENAVVVLDFTLFDIADADELQILHERFPLARWILFSEELSLDFVRRMVASPSFSVLLKESPLAEIRSCLMAAGDSQRMICQRMMELLLVPAATAHEEVKLTRTEREILVDIAQGLTTKEIAEKRFSSFHTVNTHRKNIFRKLGVNTVHEATKYALRAGLVDSSDYYI